MNSSGAAVDQKVAACDKGAAAVLWLCSPAASFVIGAALPVDGGFTAH
ncbi:short-chain dehydrogenase/reductase [Sphingomonas sp. LH128]|nr:MULTISPECIES: SDR family oxidoreductase [Sphingomonadaceae]EJU14752.1 short-chain dehydrogenase/reductase [Sphingomonas sp. LH128]MBF7014804.1 SDR family oxidoreductase [Novosphingobium sp. HR1a]